jgi:hypothetical protein
MATLVLQNQSRFECLFNRTHDYDFLHTFGCLCFSFLRPYHAYVFTKLFPTAPFTAFRFKLQVDPPPSA